MKNEEMNPREIGTYYLNRAYETLKCSQTPYIRQYLLEALMWYRKAAKYDKRILSRIQELEAAWREVNCFTSHEEVLEHLLGEVKNALQEKDI